MRIVIFFRSQVAIEFCLLIDEIMRRSLDDQMIQRPPLDLIVPIIGILGKVIDDILADPLIGVP